MWGCIPHFLPDPGNSQAAFLDLMSEDYPIIDMTLG
jgi:hypothetical protein